MGPGREKLKKGLQFQSSALNPSLLPLYSFNFPWFHVIWAQNSLILMQ